MEKRESVFVLERESERKVCANEQAGESEIWRRKEREGRREKERKSGLVPSIFLETSSVAARV